MKIKYIVYYKDGTSEMLEFEKPPGAMPRSLCAGLEALRIAESSGKVVDKLGTAEVNPFSRPPDPIVIDEDLISRADLVALAKKVIVPPPSRLG